ncbi:MAG: hypothetical protein EOP04_01600 [Proteobacteria bacterium]|nr:MAG: hypothetical protein EOP04_01600 [Pseudomonadota bacterium]
MSFPIRVQKVQNKTLKCPFCSAPLLDITGEKFTVRQGQYWIHDGDCFNEIYAAFDQIEHVSVNFEASSEWGKCRKCRNTYFTIGLDVSKNKYSFDWWNKFLGYNEDVSLGNYAIRPISRHGFFSDEWYMYSVPFKGVRVDRHTFGPFSVLAHDAMSRQLSELLPQLTSLAASKTIIPYGEFRDVAARSFIFSSMLHIQKM